MSKGAPLGLGGQKLWTRAHRSRRDPKGRPAYGGENLHWQEVIEDCGQALAELAPNATPWYQLDRGADCWQVLTFAKEAAVTLTVRAVHDRRLDDQVDRLWQAAEKAPVLATQWVDVAERPPTLKRQRRNGKSFNQPTAGQRARKARVAIRAVSLPLRVSTPSGAHSLQFNAVLVREVKKSKQQLCWLLLTTAPIHSRKAVLQVVRGYTFRWRVEDFHRAWKRGLCRVEETQLRSLSAISKWVTLLASVATRAMRLTHLARQTPDVPATDELTPLELEALIALRAPKTPPSGVPTLKEAVTWIADLGGYSGPWNGPPGPTVIGRGLHDVLTCARAFEYRNKSG